MLVLARHPKESIFIGDDIKVTVLTINGNVVRIGIEAPKDIKIYREEIAQMRKHANTKPLEQAYRTEE